MIRKANKNDSEQITKIHINSWKTTYNNFFSKELFINQEKKFDESNTRIKKAIELNNEYHYIVYEENNTIKGFACYGNARGFKFKDMGEVYSIYLEKKYQGYGIGTKLMVESFNLLKKEGFNKIIVRCLKGNTSEIFYQKLGGKLIDFETNKVDNKNIIENVYLFKI